MIEGEDYKYIDFTVNKLPIDTYDNCRFIGCNFASVHMSNIDFIECEFEDCNLSNTYVKSSAFKEVIFKNCKVIGVLFGECNPFLLNLRFEGCQLNLSSFYDLNLKNTTFKNCLMHEVDFTETVLVNASFDQCDLLNAHFERTDLQKADFRTAENYSFDPELNKLKGARFSLDGLPGLVQKYGIKVS